ncbi:MAG: hypothetical protein LBM78_02340 [Clostridiales bacterium]|jgi:shikimate dehydrogenase|nr:hypothetical protein [Clostridiales bacterium]
MSGTRTPRFALLGRTLGHSYSKRIHAHFGYGYDLAEVEPEALAGFMEASVYDGFNVTVPYKEAVLPYLSEVRGAAKALGVVNTVVRETGRWIGYNTDAAGMTAALRFSKIEIKNRKIVIFGGGGTSKTAQYVCAASGARAVVVISRGGAVTYADLPRHADADVVINTTPVGMFPRVGERLADLSVFTALKGAFDVVYNPLYTDFLLQAKAAGIPHGNGLYMLAAQAVAARNLFLGSPDGGDDTDTAYERLLAEVQNIVLIGMPGVGKSTLGAWLAKAKHMPFIDTDAYIAAHAHMSIPQLFDVYGEAHFRALELQAARTLGGGNARVLALGGGTILVPGAYEALKQNAVIVLLTRNARPDAADRPLLRDPDAYERLYNERMPKYRLLADAVIDLKDNSIAQSVAALKHIVACR